MNRKRVQKLRDVIAGIPEEKVELNIYLNGDRTPCGSVGCIAGWAELYFPELRNGLTGHEHFFGVWSGGLFSFKKAGEQGTDKQIALRRLDKLLKTGTQP